MPLWLQNLLRLPTEDPSIHALPPTYFPHNLSNNMARSRSTATMPTATSSTMNDNVLPLPAVCSRSPSIYGGASTHHHPTPLETLSVHWSRFKRRIGTATIPSSSSFPNLETYVEKVEGNTSNSTQPENDFVDEVVVDRTWSEDFKSSEPYSDHAVSPEKSSISHPANVMMGEEDAAPIENCGIWTPFAVLRWRTWPLMLKIFSSRFADEQSETQYAQENWFLKKSLALWAALWLICNWVLGCIFIPHNPIASLDKIFYFGVAPFLSLPVVFMVIYDWPRDRPYFYQVFVVVSIWCWSFYQVIFILSCGYYTPKPNCQNRDFMAAFYYTTALQTIALFGLKLNRFPAALGALIYFLFASISIIPVRRTWSRSMINFFIFQSFLIYVHYMREASERRLYVLRDQLKSQFKETQKAQISQKKASDSKRRLTSYVFHDMFSSSVRVPLNTALLAVQNMEASGRVAKDQEIEFNALCGSLHMMSKVLNDVLDFNRLDSGNFESMSRPYAFHHVMRSLFVPLRLATDARGLKLETDLDPNIDIIARLAAYKAMDEKPEMIKTHMRDNPDVAGVVTGDETRLRQIITNLASNACKFTPSGGKLTIRTRLVLPSVSKDVDLVERECKGMETETGQRPLSTDYLTKHNKQHEKDSETIVVRVEVVDTGFGIKRADMEETKLFSAFNQTEQGKQQGGKGTGLGLALVRQIVRLSGGRLGVQSKPGEGSTFWVEMPLGVGSKTFNVNGPDLPDVLKAQELDLDPLTHRRRRSRQKPPKVVETEAMRLMQHPDTSAQHNSAMQGIMEQGGRVELVLRNRGYDRTPPVDASLEDPLSRFSLESQAVNRPPSSQNMERPSAPDTGQLINMQESSPPESLKATPTQRPTYVRLPSPQNFVMETEDTTPPALTDSTSSQSIHTCANGGPSSLNMFDNTYTRGSPSASFSRILIEPNLPVLVVDDDPMTRTLMKRVLTRLGCWVVCAENGEIALEMILGQRAVTGTTPSSDVSRNSKPILEQQDPPPSYEGQFAVIFLDNQMPVMSGLRVVERLRELGRADFVVGVTGNALLSDQTEYLQAGVDRVLTKPVLERNLRDVLVQADERRKATTREPPTEKTPT